MDLSFGESMRPPATLGSPDADFSGVSQLCIYEGRGPKHRLAHKARA